MILGALLALMITCVCPASPELPGAAPPAAEAADGRQIRVGLAHGLDLAQATCEGPHDLIVAEDGEVIASGAPGRLWTFSADARRVSVSGQGSHVGPLILRPQADAPVRFGGQRYRGELWFLPGSGRVTVVNRLGLEEYLWGVVPREVPAGWPTEALKAQAVAARTYACYVMESGKHMHQGFDVCATVDCQVYGGRDWEDSRTTAAVQATQGEVVTYGGSPIRAYFHSCSGGHTENSEYVWGAAFPYLQGVPDYDQDATKYTWEAVYTVAELEQLLVAGGVPASGLYGIETGPGRGVSGRVLTVRLGTPQGRVELPATRLRTLIGLNSTLFELSYQRQESREVRRLAAAGETVAVRDGSGTRTVTTPAAAVAISASGQRYRVRHAWVVGRRDLAAQVTFTGRGWGHGTGLSQWGARGLALYHGYNYRQILGYYYQGTTIDIR